MDLVLHGMAGHWSLSSFLERDLCTRCPCGKSGHPATADTQLGNPRETRRDRARLGRSDHEQFQSAIPHAFHRANCFPGKLRVNISSWFTLTFVQISLWMSFVYGLMYALAPISFMIRRHIPKSWLPTMTSQFRNGDFLLPSLEVFAFVSGSSGMAGPDGQSQSIGWPPPPVES